MSVFAKIKAEISAVIASLEGDFSKLEEKLHLKVDEVVEDHKDSVVVKPAAINSNSASAVPVAPATEATATAATATAADDQSSAETKAEPKAEDDEAPSADGDSGDNKAAE